MYNVLQFRDMSKKWWAVNKKINFPLSTTVGLCALSSVHTFTL